MPASWLVRLGARSGFFCQQLPGGGGHYLIAGRYSLGNKVTVRCGLRGVDFDSLKDSGFLFHVTPVLAFTHDSRRRGNHNAGRSLADGCPHLEPLTLPRLAALEQRKKTAPWNTGIGGRIPYLLHVPTHPRLVGADVCCAKPNRGAAT